MFGKDHELDLEDVGGSDDGVGSTDATEELHSRLIEALNENRRLRRSLNQVFFRNPVGMATVETSTQRIVDVNERLCDMLGYTREEMLGMTVRDITHPDDMDSELKDISAVRSGMRTGYSIEKRYLRKDGRAILVRLTSCMLPSDGHSEPLALGVVCDISESRQIEQRLMTTAQRQNRTEALAGVGTFEMTPGNETAYWSDQSYRIFGIDPIRGAPTLNLFYGLVHPADRQMVQENFSRAFTDLVPTEAEFRILRPDGKVRIIRGRSESVTDAQGKLLHVIGTNQDVTDLAVERADQRRFAEIVAESPHATVIVSHDDTFVYANRAYAQMHGLSPEDLVGQPMSICHSSEQMHHLRRIIDEAWRIGRLGPVEILHPKGKGSEAHALVTALVHRDAFGEGRYLSVTLTDISAMRESERARQSSQEAAMDIMRSIPSGLFIYQFEAPDRLRLVDGNREATRLTGIDITGCRNMLFDELWPEARAQRLTEKLLKVMATGRPFETEEFDYHDSRLAGAYRIRGFRMPGDRLGVAFEDITARKATEEAAGKLQERILHSQKLESLGSLAGGVAHDFNNLLMGVLGNAEIALQDVSPVSPVRQSIEEIKIAAGRAAELCKQMLAYAGRGPVAAQPIDLTELVDETAHMLELAVSAKSVLRFNLRPNLPAVEADVSQIRQVLLNLVTNASEAIGERSGYITITTGAMECDHQYLQTTYSDLDLPEGLYVTLEVSDTGCGIEPGGMPKLFDPFYTTKFPGRGLGLAAALGIIRGHMGAVKVYSESGQGAIFKVLLPACDRPAEPLATDCSLSERWSGAGMVLLADDEESVRNVGKRMLEKCGFEVILAEDGQQAVDAFTRNADSIKLVLLDLTMPTMNGEEAYRAIRRLAPDVPVIVSSGYHERDVQQRFLGKGVAGFIQKPYRMETLVAKLRELIGTQ